MRVRRQAWIIVFAVAWAFGSVANAQINAVTPRQAMRGYLEAANAANFERAAEYLDLTGLAPSVRARRGVLLARELKEVLDHTLWVNLDQLSDEADGDLNDGLRAGRDLAGIITRDKFEIPLYLDQRPGPEGIKVWRISATTLAQIPDVYKTMDNGQLGEYLPPVFFEASFLGLALWQWIGLALALLLSAALSWLISKLVIWLLRPLVRRSHVELDERWFEVNAGPFRLIVFILLFASLTAPLALKIQAVLILRAAQKALLVTALVWALVRITDLMARLFEQRLNARGQHSATSAVPLGRRVVKILLLAMGFLAVLQNFGVNVTGVLAGLGIGGLAVALAAQKTVENLFGGVTLIADQPVRVGDFCRFGDRTGTVEEIGLRSTRIRTPERTLVSVPNAEFSQLKLENFSKRDRILFSTTVGLRYETTPAQIRKIIADFKELLDSHPKVHPEPARVRLVRLGAYSLDVEIFAYVITRDFNEFLAVQEELLLKIMDLVAAAGSDFAFPSQTIYKG